MSVILKNSLKVLAWCFVLQVFFLEENNIPALRHFRTLANAKTNYKL